MMKFKDLMDVLSVNVSFEICDKNSAGVDFYTFMKDVSCHNKYADREIEIISPSRNSNLVIYLK